MVLAGACIILSQLVSFTLAAAIEPQVFVPVSLSPIGDSNVEARDLLWDGGRAFQPRPKVELLYAQHGSDSTNPYVINVTASHKSASYILIEDFEDMLSEIRCANDTANAPASMVLRFKSSGAFEHARNTWAVHDKLLFVTHHGSCNEGHKRGVYKASSIKFEERNLDVTIGCRYEELGDSSHASSLIQVSGGLSNSHLTRRLRRRTAYPRDGTDIMTNASAFSFDLHHSFPYREPVLQASGSSIYCVNCSMEGVIEAAFKFTINTDIASVLRGLGDDFGELGKDAKEALVVFGVDVNSVSNGIVNIFKAIGDEIGKFFHSVASALGLARRDKESSADGFLRGVVQEMSISINDTTPVAGRFNIELFSNALGALPGSLSVSLGPRLGFSGLPAPFKIGGWTFEIVPEPLGASMSIQMRPGTNVTFPITVDLAIPEPLKIDLVGPSGGSMNPSINLGRPILNTFDPTICLNMAIGPSITALLSNSAVKTTLSLQASIVLPRLKVCFNEEQKVDSKCAPNGPIQDALSITTIMAIGLELEADVQIFGFTLIDNIVPKDLIALGLFQNFTLSKNCIDKQGYRPGEPLNSTPQSVVDGKVVTPVRARGIEEGLVSAISKELVTTRSWWRRSPRQQRDQTDRAPPLALAQRRRDRKIHNARSAILMRPPKMRIDR